MLPVTVNGTLVDQLDRPTAKALVHAHVYTGNNRRLDRGTDDQRCDQRLDDQLKIGYPLLDIGSRRPPPGTRERLSSLIMLRASSPRAAGLGVASSSHRAPRRVLRASGRFQLWRLVAVG